MNINRIILSGGGTGGHVYPALAIYKRLKELNPNLECLYIGTDKGLEAQIVPQAGLKFATIEISGLKRSLSLDNLKVVWQMIKSVNNAKKIIKDFAPDVIVGTGGFVCAPVLYAGAKLNIPTLIHEQNSIAGLTNKFLSKYVDKIAISFAEAKDNFAKYSQKVIFTGNPRGQEMANYVNSENVLHEYQLNETKPSVLIFGGSRGAPAINQAAIDAIPSFGQETYQVIIGTGNVHYEEWKAYISEHHLEIPANVQIVPYINNMPALFQSIDLVVSRSGATTLAELTALGLPSILIPSPYVTSNHQEHNAQSLVNQGAAIMIRENELSSDKLYQTINKVMNDTDNLTNMANQARKLGTPNAIDDIIKAIEEIV